ncbi:MAG: MlaD family protein [Chitinispirillales bacterium]|nr:MlaD family protein [Chitinispirillales bacterium]
MAITAAQKVRLGVFVIIGMVVLAVFIITPIAMKLTHRTKTYIAFFEHESLQGLEQGASVKFNGVSIGRVQRVSYYPEDINKMKVEMRVAENFPMRVDMHAKTGLIGITGLKYIEITGGTNEAPLLKAGGEIETRPPFFHGIGGRVDTLARHVETLLLHLGALTNPDSLQSIKIAVDNIADLTGDAKLFFGDLRDIVPSVHVVIDSVQAAVSSAVNITHDIKYITEAFKTGIDDSNIPGLFAQVDSTLVTVRALTENLTLTVLQTREDFSVTMENLRDATESANQLMRMLSENPSLLIRGDVRERDRR